MLPKQARYRTAPLPDALQPLGIWGFAGKRYFPLRRQLAEHGRNGAQESRIIPERDS